MKTQTFIAAALTVALIAAAAALISWRSQADPPVAPQSLAENRSVPPTEPMSTEKAGAQSVDRSETPYFTWTGLPVSECKWGSERFYDKESGEMLWACSRSGYWDYTTETLEAMAYADAEAARVLAHRIRETDYPRALNLVQRSTALSGDVISLIEARNWRPMVRRNGDVDLSGVGQAYVLMAAADRISKPRRSRSARYEEMIRQVAEDPDVTLQELNDIVNYMLHKMQQIEIEVTGQSTIAGDDDA